MEDAVTLCAVLSRNLDIFRYRLGAPANADVLIRRFQSGAFESALIAIDGMVNMQLIDENILKPCMDLPQSAGEDVQPSQRTAFLMGHAVSILAMKMKDNIDEIISDVLGGQCALVCEGCSVACVMDTRGFEKRTIGRPEAEQVVLGPHESFTESIRTNITQLRRIVQREELITEFISAGGKMKTRCALLYLRGTADEAMAARIRAQLENCSYDFPLTTGEIEQLIEENVFSLLPQCVRTERPDRAASFLAEGQIIVLTDGSPAVLGAPATIYHQLHTPDDASMRWQYGTFLRIVRTIGMLLHVLLPGAYLAVLRFHQQLLSPMLLTSVYETSSRVPIPVFLEALLMTLAFDLINEAGLRAPGAMGNALGIVSGLILGQSAVSADIVSPLLLIVIAASGLGGFCVPSYALSIGLKIVQLMLLCAGAAGGLYAMVLVLGVLLCSLCAMNSLGSPLTAPLTPPRRGNPDIFLRLPMQYQKAKAFFAKGIGMTPEASPTNPSKSRRSASENGTYQKNLHTSNMHEQRIRAAWRTRACAAGLCVGAQVFLAGCAVGMPLALSSAWLAALPSLGFAAWLTIRCHRALLQSNQQTRSCCFLLFIVLLASAAFALVSMTGFSSQTLSQQARPFWIEAAALIAALFCALSGGTGTARLCFALRYLLPALVLGLSVVSLPMRVPVGLFPILGAGAGPLGLASLAMLFGAAPTLILMFPPPELDEIPQDKRLLPDVSFFLRRILAGALAGTLLLFLTSACTTYESIARSSEWGARLRMAAGNQPHEGTLQMILTLAKLTAMLLLSVNMLCVCAHALGLAVPRLAGKYTGLAVCAALLAGVLFVHAVWGDMPVLLSAPVIALGALMTGLFAGRRMRR